MPNITTFEILDTLIKKAGGKPTVLEALWDGDTEGWYLCLSIYTVSGFLFKKEETRHFLGVVTISEGMEYFTNGNRTVSELAKQFGEKAIEKYNLTFYFPSEKDADDDCPKWADRHLAINCADCDKLIIPTNSPYLPKNICYNCHLTRERNDKIKNESPCDDGVTMYLSKDDEFEKLGYCTYFKDFTIATYINDKVPKQLDEHSITIITLEKSDIIKLRDQLEEALSKKLENYIKPEIAEKMKRLVRIYKVEYKGVEYELADRFNNDHNEVSLLLASVKTSQKAFLEDYTYKIYFKKGITYRDDSILRFVNYVCQGSTDITEITEHYKKELTEREVLKTLYKLEQFNCLTIGKNEVCMTTTGKNIV